MTSQWRYQTWLTSKCRFSGKYRPKWNFSPKKVPKIGISPGVLLITEGVVFLICSVSFRTIPWRFFFSNSDLKYFEVATTPFLWTLKAYPTTILGGTPGIFFHQNDYKGYKRNYPDAQDCFVLRFGATGKITPLRKTRVKHLQCWRHTERCMEYSRIH